MKEKGGGGELKVGSVGAAAAWRAEARGRPAPARLRLLRQGGAPWRRPRLAPPFRAGPPAGPRSGHGSGPRSPGWLRDLAGAWIFYSVLPGWSRIAPRFDRIARFAPWVAVVLGLLQAALWALLQGRVPLLTQVALVLALGLLLSGGLHMDGAMDTADGLAAGDRCLEAMRDSRIGASGAQALVLVLLLKAAALASLGAIVPVVLPWAAFWSRVAPLVAIDRFPSLRPSGGGALHRRHWAGLAVELRPALLLLVLLLVATCSQGWPAAGLWGGLPALLVPLWLGRRLGGHSGDSYGACVEWSESLALLLAAAVWLGWGGGALVQVGSVWRSWIG